MNLPLTDTDYMEAWEGMHPTENRHRFSSTKYNQVEVVAELRLLSTELTISVDILGKIQNSVRVLSQSLEEHL